MTVAKELAEYKLDSMGVQEVRWDNTHFPVEMGMKIMN
jgi:hypothetical protein